METSDAIAREIVGVPAAVEAVLAGIDAQRDELHRAWSRARRVVLVGTGASLAIVRVAAPLLVRSGAELIVRESTPAVVGSDGHAFRPGDLAIFVSQSGASPETVLAARAAREPGARVIAITAREDSPLADAAELVIHAPGTDGEGRASGAAATAGMAPAGSWTGSPDFLPLFRWEPASLVALGGIGHLIDTGPAPRERLAESLAALVETPQTVLAAGSALAAARNPWFVGFGPAEGIAEVGALLWHQTVHRPAGWSSPSSFRHSLVEAFGPNDALVAIDTLPSFPDRTSYLELLADEVRALGGIFVSLGARSTSDERSMLLSLPARAPLERSLAALVRVQQLARAAAHAAGTYREGFAAIGSIVRPWGPRSESSQAGRPPGSQG